MRVVSIVIASAILSIVFYSGFGKAMMDDLKAAGPDMLDVGYLTFACGKTSIAIAKLAGATIGPGTMLNVAILLILIILMVSFIVIPLLPAAVVYLVLRTTTSFRLSAAALSVRLWRVTAGVCLLVVLNYLSLWVEQQPWALGLSR